MRPASLLASLAALALASGSALADWTADGVRLCGSPGIQRDPYAAFDGHGAIVVWEDQRAGVGNADVYAARVLPTGSLPAEWAADGMPVCTAAGAQQNPRIVPDGAGGAYVTWDDARNGAMNYDVYLQRLTRDGAPAPGWPADGLALASGTGNQYAAIPCTDGAGGVYVAWVDERQGATDSDIYLTRVLANGVIAPGWAAGGTAACDTTDLQSLPDIVPDGLGGAVVSWLDRRSGTEYDLFAKRFTPAGAPAAGWPAQGSPVCTASGDQLTPVAVPDGAGGVYVVWNDFRTGVGDVFAQHLGPGGQPVTGWDAGGNAIGGAAGSQYAPQAAPDGQGGFFAVWEDYQSTGDVVGTRVNADGTRPTGWGADGNPICLATASQFSPVVIADGTGGAYVAWEDQRNVGFNNDIWGVRLLADASLATGWAADGDALCTAGGYQYFPSFATDGAGGAYVTWQDRRNLSHFDVYVSRLGPAGTPVAGAPAIGARGASLALAGANPFRGESRVRLTLAREGDVRVDVLDTGGRRVRTIARGVRAAGVHDLAWDGRDDAGRETAAGVYFVRALGGTLDARLKLVRAR